jgi:hypothetical protein
MAKGGFDGISRVSARCLPVAAFGYASVTLDSRLKLRAAVINFDQDAVFTAVFPFAGTGKSSLEISVENTAVLFQQPYNFSLGHVSSIAEYQPASNGIPIFYSSG